MYTSNRFLAVFALGPDRLLAPTNQPQYHLGNTRKRKLDLKKKEPSNIKRLLYFRSL